MRPVRQVCLLLAAAIAATVYPSWSTAQEPNKYWVLPPDTATLKAESTAALDHARALRHQVLAVQGERTVENTLEPLDEVTRHIGLARAPASFLKNVHPDAAMRTTGAEIEREARAFQSELMLDPGIYRAVQALEGAPGVDAEAAFYVKRLLGQFRTGGVDKSDEVRSQIAALRKEIVQLEQEFGRNIVDGRATLAIDPSVLEGLPKDYMAAHPLDAQGKVLLANDRADVQPIGQYANDASVRREVFIFSRNRGYPANVETLDKLIGRRRELAQLIGFPNFAAMQMEGRMAESEKGQRDFLDDLDRTTRELATSQVAEILTTKQKDVPTATAVEPWDSAYYIRKLREERYKFDEQETRPYFPYSQVKDGVLAISTKLFGVSFLPVEIEVWHPTVEVYDVLEDGKVLGRIYLDMFPRAGKYQHFASTSVRPGVQGKQLPEGALMCNFTQPTESDPALMTASLAETFFHEFGHLLHGMFAGHQRWSGLSRPELDFIEAPSQLLEEWFRDPGVLGTFARHYETGEPIPQEMVERMNQASTFGEAVGVRRQLWLSQVALAYESSDQKVDTATVARTLHAKYVGGNLPDELCFQCSFSHLGASNYAGAYYTYQWSLAIAKDLLSGFDRGNLLDPQPARRYRDLVLRPGGSKPAAELVEDFVGRPFNLEAYRAWLKGE